MEEEPFKAVKMKFAEDGICSGEIPNPGTEGSVKYYLESVDKSGKTEYYPENGAACPCVVIISNDREPPVAEVERITTAKLDSELKVSARAKDTSGVQSVVLRYRRVSQFEDYQSEPMVYNDVSDKYEAVIPAQFLQRKYDIMYFIEVMDTRGNGRMLPDMEIETPYVVVHLDRLDLTN